LIDRAITYLSVILIGAVLFVARQASRRPSSADANAVEQ